MSETGRVVDLRRRLDNLVRVGTVAEVDLRRARVRVHYGAGAPGDGLEAQTDLIPWMVTRAGADRTWWAPTVGEQVLVLAPGGDLAGAVALPGLYQVAAPPPSPDPGRRPLETEATIVFSDGAIISYDVGAHVLRVELPDEGKVDIVGDVCVDGDVEATGEVEDATSTMQAMRDTYNAHTHPGGGVPSHQMT